jgi:hypothetical protein
MLQFQTLTFKIHGRLSKGFAIIWMLSRLQKLLQQLQMDEPLR